MTSAESESAAAFFPTEFAHAGVLLTTPMSGPKSCLDSFLFVLSAGVTLTTTAPFWAIAAAARDVLVSVRARKGEAWMRRVRFQVEYWL